jgi:ankyrin repeat protein
MDPALHSAAEQGDVPRLRELVAGRPAILSSRTPQGNTALHMAAERGHASFAEEVLVMNEELLVSQNDNGDTPLHLAARAGKVDVVELLIGRSSVWSYYHQAAQTGEAEVSSPLLMGNRHGDTPLHEALKVKRGSTVVALKLFAAEPSCGHAPNKRKESPLYLAAGQGLLDVVSKIVSMPWVHEKFVPDDYISGTALHQAVLGGFTRK